MTPDPKIDCARAAVVALGGREFFVPVLALRQARIVVPGLEGAPHEDAGGAVPGARARAVSGAGG